MYVRSMTGLLWLNGSTATKQIPLQGTTEKMNECIFVFYVN
jgi:hypothetical protein